MAHLLWQEFPTYSIHTVSCTNRKDCCIGTARCVTSAE